MDVTMHYVDPVNFQMRSKVLGVCRFKHAHTREAVAKMLLSMLNEFGIRSKMMNIVADNAANVFKASTIAINATEVRGQLVLSSETTSYMGNVIPPSMGLKCTLVQSTDILVDPLVKTLSAGIGRRFQSCFLR